jgi:hypothetical protein
MVSTMTPCWSEGGFRTLDSLTATLLWPSPKTRGTTVRPTRRSAILKKLPDDDDESAGFYKERGIEAIAFARSSCESASRVSRHAAASCSTPPSAQSVQAR